MHAGLQGEQNAALAAEVAALKERAPVGHQGTQTDSISPARASPIAPVGTPPGGPPVAPLGSPPVAPPVGPPQNALFLGLMPRAQAEPRPGIMPDVPNSAGLSQAPKTQLPELQLPLQQLPPGKLPTWELPKVAAVAVGHPSPVTGLQSGFRELPLAIKGAQGGRVEGTPAGPSQPPDRALTLPEFPDPATPCGARPAPAQRAQREATPGTAHAAQKSVSFSTPLELPSAAETAAAISTAAAKLAAEVVPAAMKAGGGGSEIVTAAAPAVAVAVAAAPTPRAVGTPPPQLAPAQSFTFQTPVQQLAAPQFGRLFPSPAPVIAGPALDGGLATESFAMDTVDELELEETQPWVPHCAQAAVTRPAPLPTPSPAPSRPQAAGALLRTPALAQAPLEPHAGPLLRTPLEGGSPGGAQGGALNTPLGVSQTNTQGLLPYVGPPSNSGAGPVVTTVTKEFSQGPLQELIQGSNLGSTVGGQKFNSAAAAAAPAAGDFSFSFVQSALVRRADAAGGGGSARPPTPSLLLSPSPAGAAAPKALPTAQPKTLPKAPFRFPPLGGRAAAPAQGPAETPAASLRGALGMTASPAAAPEVQKAVPATAVLGLQQSAAPPQPSPGAVSASGREPTVTVAGAVPEAASGGAARPALVPQTQMEVLHAERDNSATPGQEPPAGSPTDGARAHSTETEKDGGAGKPGLAGSGAARSLSESGKLAPEFATLPGVLGMNKYLWNAIIRS